MSNNNIIKVLGGIVVIVAAYIIYTQFITSPISQEFITWEQSGSEVDFAKIDKPVTLNLIIYSNSIIGYKGNIKIEIRKDLILGRDEVVTSRLIPVNIPAGFNKKQPVHIEFVPNEKTGVLRVREYFYKIYIGNEAIFDPTDAGERRNGLHVGAQASGGSVPTVTGILFNGKPQISVSAGTIINTQVKMSGKGGGQLKIEIRRDYALLTDSTYTTISKDVVVDGLTVVDLDKWSAAEQGIGFREYFARVYWNGDLIYDPDSPTEREYVKISSDGGTTDGTTTPGSVILRGAQWNINPNAYSTLKTIFKITGSYNGVVTVDIRKDVSFGSDIGLQSKRHTISGTDKEVTVITDFIAPNSGDWVFVRVTPNIYDNTDRNNRKAQGTEVQVAAVSTSPTVTPSLSPSGMLAITDVAFGSPPVSVFTFRMPVTAAIYHGLGGEVPVYVYAKAKGYVEKQVTVNIRKDIVGGTDKSYKNIVATLRLQDEERLTYVGVFTPDEITSNNLFGVRQYFAKVDINSDGSFEYNPTDPNTRSHVRVI